ncbi:TPA: DUF3037 domain-containing protein [Stenotrophomonas maltophilia]|uniref:DUF3037 domain-containing protein n=1 Tax=Stenotrophomonas maltophilia TaxID=40324 RepID=A0AAI9CGU6_STEMA|nr:DUF3037 domain-containing protein [Stenotrophomonas maltophilia]EJP79921.1 hypothetical protein A1OC_02944 [Stenotrophomonas maltophilia Ab55555]EKT2105057.1 DUF3037 domain-containing protein [Stenotrophomonas maltophilia]EKZ1926374.1 DUF3037 domain-containing protein [Stenotrophomonas maltophilia]ELE7121424.1 DUF3037 domain-containing protein [Stenotrophomonas maltophilia]EMB2744360.1 DUF3037 domain-containing protein [Stenotrophomonas maltophilia]
MPTLHTYDYAVIRVVPRVEREEFINVGVIVSCPGARHLEAAIEIDPARLRAFAPALDQEALQPWLDAIVAICRGDASAGPIAQLPARARFHFLTAKRSSVVQMSSTHVGRTADPAGVVEHLMTKMVRVPAPNA